MNHNDSDGTQYIEQYLREDRMPHIWCPGCGLGSVLHCFLSGLIKSGLSIDKTVVVSGIGCTGRVAGYVTLDSFHTTHGRAIPFATGLKLANPELKVVVFSGDGDLVAIGGESPDSCCPQEYRHDCNMRQQSELRNDWRSTGTHYPTGSTNSHITHW